VGAQKYLGGTAPNDSPWLRACLCISSIAMSRGLDTLLGNATNTWRLLTESERKYSHKLQEKISLRWFGQFLKHEVAQAFWTM